MLKQDLHGDSVSAMVLDFIGATLNLSITINLSQFRYVITMASATLATIILPHSLSEYIGRLRMELLAIALPTVKCGIKTPSDFS